ncbi:TonB-linked outer membrane protein, SusC/RagA family [Dyadobacter koreensis]|uniref:TonB-linked outer membrane protein, SusC/RagA family n=1 Tax=Dyadobacter koreensis TaxID=408657 RepID=A0A1H6R3B1_9BACT|nr:SusC/RagA family TonB-linked outer membrane protein [Dyadobacter koreensis]SEI46270.1 TonB-linked outer membrane protein, SusC/RagA family [Dyadobacter koreensis]
MRTYVTFFLAFYLLPGFFLSASGQFIARGMVVSASDSLALPGAVVKVKGGSQGVTTDEKGRFQIALVDSSARLQISYIGFRTLEISVRFPLQTDLTAALSPDANQLGEVVVSTGYQTVPRERATGSFSSVSHALFNRRVSTDVISRLNDLVPGLITNRGTGSARGLLIRGQSTINSSARPLIVIDNFPYEGDLSTLNPNDVESVTVLKDAAAASIWGARAGNGVIVITTKKGAIDAAPKISFNTNFTAGQMPDLFYQSQTSAADFIENERLRFEAGSYSNAEKNIRQYPFTPAVETLIAARDKTITPQQAQQQLDAFKQIDVRNDYQKYLYQPSLNQQYSLGIQGSGSKNRYFLSGGYDRSRASEVGNHYERFSFNASNTYAVSRRLDLTAGIYFIQSTSTQNSQGLPTYTNALTGYTGTAMYPYARLADGSGNPLDLIRQNRLSFVQKAAGIGLLDWSYNPIREISLADNKVKLTDYRMNLTADYRISKALRANILYQYARGISEGRNYYSAATFTARNLVNSFSSIGAGGTLVRPIPAGGILDQATSAYQSHNLRSQLDYSQSWGRHEVSAIAGAELRDLARNGSTYRVYGYDNAYATGKAVDYVTFFPNFVNPSNSSRIPYLDTKTGESDRYLSYYANAAYTFQKRYVFSASARLDQSNLFGVKTNDKGVPLFSSGLAWNLSQEPFYHAAWLPYLKLRATYGSSGNSNKNVSAFTTAAFGAQGDAATGATYATIQNPPNPSLRWERIQTFNAGVDFDTRNRVFSGSLEYYHKKGIDLIGVRPYPGSSGIKTFTGNYAATKGQGIDLSVQARIFDKEFKWYSMLLMSQVTDKVTKYDETTLAVFYLGNGDGAGTYPLEGKPLYALYSLRWAGLDPLSGDPLGYVDGEVSKDYAAILSADPSQMIYHGPARPKVFGAFRQTVSWKALSLSVNMTYRLGYFYRARSVSYSDLADGLTVHGDYGLRWQQPGDEQRTQVPSQPAFPDSNRDNFYLLSQGLVKKADHVRLQDVNLSYNWSKKTGSAFPFSTAQLYVYADNLGILWKASKGKLDPDYAQALYALPRTLSIGLKLDF